MLHPRGSARARRKLGIEKLRRLHDGQLSSASCRSAIHNFRPVARHSRSPNKRVLYRRTPYKETILRRSQNLKDLVLGPRWRLGNQGRLASYGFTQVSASIAVLAKLTKKCQGRRRWPCQVVIVLFSWLGLVFAITHVFGEQGTRSTLRLETSRALPLHTQETRNHSTVVPDVARRLGSAGPMSAGDVRSRDSDDGLS